MLVEMESGHLVEMELSGHMVEMEFGYLFEMDGSWTVG